jgi:anti-sigma B factor antagonist
VVVVAAAHICRSGVRHNHSRSGNLRCQIVMVNLQSMGVFSTKVVRGDDGTVIYVQGEIDMSTAERLRDAIEPHMGPEQTIVLDLSGVEFMDSACIKVLVQARGKLTEDGGSLILRNPSSIAHQVLSLTGVEFILADDAEDHPQTG